MGYDAVADPNPDHVIWRLLALPRPQGLKLLPELWTSGARPEAAKLPKTAISLIIQYKRPEWITGGRAAQWHFWNRPYFRFPINSVQQAKLHRLEQATAPHAMVRYASPAFWTVEELEVAQHRFRVLQSTGFVAPENLHGHKFWTYSAPGNDGRANPGASSLYFESYGGLLHSISNSYPHLSGSGLQIRQLEAQGNALRYRNPILRNAVDMWAQGLRTIRGVTNEMALQVRDYATVQSAVASAGAHWLIVDLEKMELPNEDEA